MERNSINYHQLWEFPIRRKHRQFGAFHKFSFSRSLPTFSARAKLKNFLPNRIRKKINYNWLHVHFESFFPLPCKRRRPPTQDPAEGRRAIASPRDPSEWLRPTPEDSSVTLEFDWMTLTMNLSQTDLASVFDWSRTQLLLDATRNLRETRSHD